jgi:hypothetical protein
MDQFTPLAAAAVNLLSPYLARLGGNVANQAVDKLSQAAIPAVGNLYELLKKRLGQGTYEGNQLAGLEEKPADSLRQQVAVATIAEALKRDPEFERDLRRLLEQAEPASMVTASFGDVQGPVALRDIKVKAKNFAGRDQVINEAAPRSKRRRR